MLVAGAGLTLAPPDTLPHPPRLVAAPTDTLVRVLPCPGPVRVPVGSILFAGNAVTRERILRAELDFHEGDTLALADLPARLEVNRRRLFNLQLFHSVVVQATCTGGRLLIVFGVQERWYTFPVPILSLADRNLRSWLDRADRWRRVDYGLHLTRTNFRGRNEQLIVNLQLGFNRKYELFYEVPGLGRYRRLGFGVGASYFQSHTLDYRTTADRLIPLRADNAFSSSAFTPRLACASAIPSNSAPPSMRPTIASKSAIPSITTTQVIFLAATSASFSISPSAAPATSATPLPIRSPASTPRSASRTASSLIRPRRRSQRCAPPMPAM